MKTLFWIIVSLLFLFTSCLSAVDNAVIHEDKTTTSLLEWETLKTRFPNENIIRFDFDAKGNPKNDLSRAIELDSLVFEELINKVPLYLNWKEYIKIYYYSTMEIDGEEFGIFLVEEEFNGLKYNFDLLQFDNLGNVMKCTTLSKSWEAAECIGYTRAFIDFESMQLYQEVVEKCYIIEDNSLSVDSSGVVTKLKDL